MRWLDGHQLNGHAFEQTPGDSEGQGSLVCYSSWGHKELDMTEATEYAHYQRVPWKTTHMRKSGQRICCYCSVAYPCLTLCNPIDCSTPGFPVIHHLPELAQTHIHSVNDAIQPSHPLSPIYSNKMNILNTRDT